MTHENGCNSLDSLLKIMQALRAQDGCPWDLEQTPESLAPYILEEACELIDAVEDGAPELVLDELGDLLLQIVFQAQIFKERQQFDFYDVAAGIADKLVRRHPHVFARSQSAVHADGLDRQWDEIKRAEATHNKTCLADHLPGRLPALQRAQKLINRAYRENRYAELPAADHAILDLFENPDSDIPQTLDEKSLGQALFSLAKLAHDAGLDAEAALRKATRRALEALDLPKQK